MAYAEALFFFFFRLLVLINLLTVSFCDDAAVMFKLLAALSPTPSGWSNSTHPCLWDNVSCESRSVVSINLAAQSLSGELPSELTHLALLQMLYVQLNSLSGRLPSFANMSMLESLYLHSNQFSSIPQDFLLGLTNLKTFTIYDNHKLSPWELKFLVIWLKADATGRATNKVDVYAFGVVLMEIITGKKAVDETLPDETCHLVTWFHKIIRKGHNLKNTIDPTLDLDDQTFESISKVAELAAHCTANKYFQRPTMEHVVNVLGPFAQKWKPLRLEEIEEKYGGLDLHMSLPLFAFDDSSIESLSFTEAKLNGHRLNQSAQF